MWGFPLLSTYGLCSCQVGGINVPFPFVCLLLCSFSDEIGWGKAGAWKEGQHEVWSGSLHATSISPIPL